MTSQGDNLDDAQAFSGLCDATLTRLVESESYIVTSKDEDVYVMSALDTIQLEAKRMKARAISRAAQTAMDGVEDLRDTKCQVRNLRDLMHLVRQYQTGLEEIQQAEPAPKPMPLPVASEQAEFETARTTLKSVIRHAGAEHDIAALSRLSNWRPDIPDSMTFEQLMPALTDEVLRAGRHHNKSVSVSYAADDTPMGPNIYHDISDATAKVAVWLVEHAIETPEQRLGQGLGQSAHMAITAKCVEGRFNVLVSCDGHVNEAQSLELPEIGMVAGYGAALKCVTSSGRVRVEMHGLSLGKETADTQKRSYDGSKIAEQSA